MFVLGSMKATGNGTEQGRREPGPASQCYLPPRASCEGRGMSASSQPPARAFTMELVKVFPFLGPVSLEMMQNTIPKRWSKPPSPSLRCVSMLHQPFPSRAGGSAYSCHSTKGDFGRCDVRMHLSLFGGLFARIPPPPPGMSQLAGCSSTGEGARQAQHKTVPVASACVSHSPGCQQRKHQLF